jgi:hypothetical protein
MRTKPDQPHDVKSLTAPFSRGCSLRRSSAPPPTARPHPPCASAPLTRQPAAHPQAPPLAPPPPSQIALATAPAPCARRRPAAAVAPGKWGRVATRPQTPAAFDASARRLAGSISSVDPIEVCIIRIDPHSSCVVAATMAVPHISRCRRLPAHPSRCCLSSTPALTRAKPSHWAM